MRLHDCVQGTPEWHAVRLGKMTASHAYTISVAGKGLSTYCRQIAAEIYTGAAFESFQSAAMQTGVEEEDFARKAYELANDSEVVQVGFAEFDSYFGASPDGLIGLDGGVEFKRKTSKCHNDLLLGVVDFEPDYVWQCHANMMVFDREWWDLVSYNPAFKERALFVKRLYRETAADEKLLAGIQAGKEEIEHYLSLY